MVILKYTSLSWTLTKWIFLHFSISFLTVSVSFYLYLHSCYKSFFLVHSFLSVSFFLAFFYSISRLYLTVNHSPIHPYLPVWPEWTFLKVLMTNCLTKAAPKCTKDFWGYLWNIHAVAAFGQLYEELELLLISASGHSALYLSHSVAFSALSLFLNVFPILVFIDFPPRWEKYNSRRFIRNIFNPIKFVMKQEGLILLTE